MDLNKPSAAQEEIVVDRLKKHLARGKEILKGGNVKRGQLKMWSSAIRHAIAKVYGIDHAVSNVLSPKLILDTIVVQDEFQKRIEQLEHFIASIDAIGASAFSKSTGGRIFIGHGKSPMWRELKDFLQDRLCLQWDEFNREAVAGIGTFERISAMLDSACFAFLIMTAEDEYTDATIHARQNVVHELGLFQGRLGPRKAIILLEEGCSEFSNIVGLSQTRFPKGHITSVFEEIRRVLERERIVNP